MGIFLVTHKYTWLAQQVRNTFYYATSVGNPTDAEWQDIVDEIRADWVAELQANLSDEITFNGIDRRQVDAAGLLTFSEVPTSGDAVGGSTDESMPTQIALLVSNKGTTAKPNRARTYLPGTVVTDVINSEYGAAARGRGQDYIDLQSNLNTGGTNPLGRVSVTWNSSHTQVVANNDISGAASVASIVPATQRRRRLGVGI